MICSGLLALRNVRLGRGDRKGAFRLAGFLLVVFFLRWLFSSHHVATEAEAFNFITGVQSILYWTFFFWVVYLAFEPFVRRRWPGRIVSWSRLLAEVFAIHSSDATYLSVRSLVWESFSPISISRVWCRNGLVTHPRFPGWIFRQRNYSAFVRLHSALRNRSSAVFFSRSYCCFFYCCSTSSCVANDWRPLRFG